MKVATSIQERLWELRKDKSSEEYNKAVLWVLCCICFSGMIELIRKLLHLVRNNAYFDINTFCYPGASDFT